MLNARDMLGRVRCWFSAASTGSESEPATNPHVYSTVAPHPQNAVDLFAGEWTSRFAPPFDDLKAGEISLFQDPRLEWAIHQLGGVSGKRILELGSFEGGHTYVLDRAGAAEILAIEANARAFLRSLVSKEIVGIRAARFVHGDFVSYLQESRDRFDVTIASGVLYHMIRPVELIARIAAISDAAFFWTHYYDETLFRARETTAKRIVQPEPAEHDGYRHALYRNDYLDAVNRPGFCGGLRSYSYWLTREDILGALRHFGYSRIEIAFEQTDHLHGPAFAVLAQR